jgi:hypothetical protein
MILGDYCATAYFRHGNNTRVPFVLSTRHNRAPFGSSCQSLSCSSSARRTKRGSAFRFGHPPGLRGLTAPLCAQTPGLSKGQKNELTLRDVVRAR